MNGELKPPILGLDVGEIRTGVALSDPLHLTAQPQDTIEHKRQKEALQTVESLIAERGVETVVVGWPRNLRGGTTRSTERAEAFAEALQHRCPRIEVILWDERLSTAQAHSAMLGDKVRRKKRREKADTIAAVLILQNYLDCHRSA